LAAFQNLAGQAGAQKSGTAGDQNTHEKSPECTKGQCESNHGRHAKPDAASTLNCHAGLDPASTVSPGWIPGQARDDIKSQARDDSFTGEDH
jgi:hypothetical protein